MRGASYTRGRDKYRGDGGGGEKLHTEGREDRHENSYLLAGSDKLPKDRFFISAQLDSFSVDRQGFVRDLVMG